MIASYFESFKYVGHLFPVAFLRFFVGYYYLKSAMAKYHGEYLVNSQFIQQIHQWLSASNAPGWYKELAHEYLLTYWHIFAYGVTSLEFLIGISFILGYLVRPFALFGFVLCLNALFLQNPEQRNFYSTLLVINFMMAWLGAGRCLGLDYFFFKRRRGIWW